MKKIALICLVRMKVPVPQAMASWKAVQGSGAGLGVHVEGYVNE
jgi:hypothetical protein